MAHAKRLVTDDVIQEETFQRVRETPGCEVELNPAVGVGRVRQIRVAPAVEDGTDRAPAHVEQEPLVPDESWRVLPSFACAQCGGPARCHPLSNYTWGCATCGTSVVFVRALPALADGPAKIEKPEW